jgi:hypothetical protein
MAFFDCFTIVGGGAMYLNDAFRLIKRVALHL